MMASRSVAIACDNASPQSHTLPQSGSELVLANLLHRFFSWAVDVLPSLGRASELSVVTGASRPRPLNPKGRASHKPLVLEVPLTAAGQNAVRCLRTDVWEDSVLPELRRGQHLARRIVAAGVHGRQAQAIVRELFGKVSSADNSEPACQGAWLGDVVTEFEEENPTMLSGEVRGESQDKVDYPVRARARKKRQRACDFPVDQDSVSKKQCGPDAGVKACGSTPRQLDAASAVAAALHESEQACKTVEAAASVERWLGLRALLSRS